MKVLSLFDWISCARIALERVWIEVENYYASEVNKYAIQVSQKNYPDIVQIGDVKKIEYKYMKGSKNNEWYYLLWDPDRPLLVDTMRKTDIDLLIWGSPCQDLSIAKKDRKGLDWERSWLFREYLRILRQVKPKYFILENVASMPSKDRDIISAELWVEPIMINAALVSAQNRKRYFWTNIPWVELPKDRGIYLKDILDDGINHIYQRPRGFNEWGIKEGKAPTMWSNAYQENNKPIKIWQFNKWWQGDRVYSVEGKSVCLSANWWGGGAKTWLYLLPWRIVGRRLNDEGKRDDYNNDIPIKQYVEINKDINKTNTISTVDKDNVIVSVGPGYVDRDKSLLVDANYQKWGNLQMYSKGKRQIVFSDELKNAIRKLTPIECERLQGVPDNYTEWVSNTQRYKTLWNAFNVDVVAHILSFIPR